MAWARSPEWTHQRDEVDLEYPPSMWEIRRASLADRDALVELCAAAAGPDDYPIGIMESMILHGVWHVALRKRTVVGAMHYRDALDGSGWLAAARTHPGYRRRGVASALVESFVGLARRRGVPALRLWSDASNVAGTASVRTAGFREVARFTRVTRATARPFRDAAPVAFSDDLLSRLRASSVLQLAMGYVPHDSTFIPSSPANVYLLCSKRRFRRIANGIACMSLSSESTERPLEVGLVAGAASAVLRTLPSVAGSLGFDAVASFIPHHPGVIAAARAAGFRASSWGREAVVFERAIEMGTIPHRTRPTYAELAARARGGSAALPPSSAHRGHGGPRASPETP